MTWSGTGTYKAYGGTWDNTAHTFTVAAPIASAAGVIDTISTGERLLFTDASTGETVGASFGTITGNTTFSASMMSQSELNALAAMPGFDGPILSGWDFNTNFAGDQVLLSFPIGLGAQNVELWHLSNGVWSPYSTDMMTYGSDGVVSFPVTGFSGYAVTAVPEPATLALLALGGLGVLRKGLRRRQK